MNKIIHCIWKCKCSNRHNDPNTSNQQEDSKLETVRDYKGHERFVSITYFNRRMTRFGLNLRIFWSVQMNTYENKINSCLSPYFHTFSINEYIGSPSVIRKYTKPIINATICSTSGRIYVVNICPQTGAFKVLVFRIWIGFGGTNELQFTIVKFSLGDNVEVLVVVVVVYKVTSSRN